jgi:hypothetical protein
MHIAVAWSGGSMPKRVLFSIYRYGGKRDAGAQSTEQKSTT